MLEDRCHSNRAGKQKRSGILTVRQLRVAVQPACVVLKLRSRPISVQTGGLGAWEDDSGINRSIQIQKMGLNSVRLIIADFNTIFTRFRGNQDVESALII